MHLIPSQSELMRLSGYELRSLIRELDSELSDTGLDHRRKHRLQTAIRAARVELSQRQSYFAPKPPGF